ncbi:MAG: Spy/CpxP family protein refolding chaperone [Muribaculaceae bacterium]|nr:Spy/CpxP family protein refolding chaperone [Muribaculaceae bacterium]
MKRIIFIILALAIVAPFNTIIAKDKKKNNREEWYAQMRHHKHDFIDDELDLTDEQEAKFFPIYDAMEDELRKVQHETRKLEKQVDDKDATDVEYDAASKAIIELKKKEADIELKYFDKFKTVLSSKQIFKLKKAEKKFTRKIMNAHNKKHKKD